MSQKATFSKTSKVRFSVPISLNWGEKYVLDELSRENNLPLSTFIKSQLQGVIQPRLKKLSKTAVLLQKIQTSGLSDSEIDLASKIGADFRKKFEIKK